MDSKVLLLVFVTASHQTGLDTRSMTQRSIISKVLHRYTLKGAYNLSIPADIQIP